MSKKPSQRKDVPSPAKARTILHDQEIRGHPLTSKQIGFFGALVSKGKKR